MGSLMRVARFLFVNFLYICENYSIMENKITYAEAMAEIERILAKFRSEEMSVDDLAADVKRATELIAVCRERLHKAEEDVKKVLE